MAASQGNHSAPAAGDFVHNRTQPSKESCVIHASTSLLAFTSVAQARFGRGLTFSEFVGIVMREPPRAIRLKDVVTFATLLGSKGGGMLGALKAKLTQPETAAAAAGEDSEGLPAAAVAQTEQ